MADDPRHADYENLPAVSQKLNALINKLVQRGRQKRDDAWQRKWREIVLQHRSQFSLYVETLKAEKTEKSDKKTKKFPVHRISAASIMNWTRLINLEGGKENRDYALYLRPKDYIGISFNQVEDASNMFCEFGYGTKADKPIFGNHGTWANVFEAALPEVQAEIEAYEHEHSGPPTPEIGEPSDEPAAILPPSYRAGNWLHASNVRLRIPGTFVGREEDLEAIDIALNPDENMLSIVALHGLRGVGKTVLAATYAHRHRTEYQQTCWVQAHNKESLRTDLIALGLRLGWVPAGARDETAIGSVRDGLSNSADSILLIFDNATNADDLRPYLPWGGVSKIIITSNSPAWGELANPLEIKAWPPGTGAEYLIARTGRTYDRPAAEELSIVLGGLPLAVAQAAAYCERLGTSFTSYVSSFEEFLGDGRYAPADYHPEHYAENKVRLTVASTFNLAIVEAARRHPAAEPILLRAALLAPEPIPLYLFSEPHEEFGGSLAAEIAGDGLDLAVAELRAFALVERETIHPEFSTKVDAIRLHRLVREIAAARPNEEQISKFQRELVRSLTAIYPRDGCDNRASWPRCASLTPHVLSLWLTDKSGLTRIQEWLPVLTRVGDYLYGEAFKSRKRDLWYEDVITQKYSLSPRGFAQ